MVIQDAAYISIVPGSLNHISNLPRSKPYKVSIVIQSNDTDRFNNFIGMFYSSSAENFVELHIIFCMIKYS